MLLRHMDDETDHIITSLWVPLWGYCRVPWLFSPMSAFGTALSIPYEEAGVKEVLYH